MKIKAVVHEAEEGGFWAEVPAIPGCSTQGETYEELLKNLQEAIEGCLSVEVENAKKYLINLDLNSVKKQKKYNRLLFMWKKSKW